jgi:hypothetical protein
MDAGAADTRIEQVPGACEWTSRAALAEPLVGELQIRPFRYTYHTLYNASYVVLQRRR